MVPYENVPLEASLVGRTGKGGVNVTLMWCTTQRPFVLDRLAFGVGRLLELEYLLLLGQDLVFRWLINCFVMDSARLAADWTATVPLANRQRTTQTRHH